MRVYAARSSKIGLLCLELLIVLALGVSADSGLPVQHVGDPAPQSHLAHLPLVLCFAPPLPDPPALLAIDNEDGEDTYTVAWGSSARAATYELQERWQQSEWLTVYADTETSVEMVRRPAGQYEYRVRASNIWGDSAWSNVESTTVAGEAPGEIARPPSRPGDEDGQSLVRVINDCPYVLHLEFAGPEPGELTVPRCDTCKVYSFIGPIFCPTEGRPVNEVRLTPGTYRVYVTVDEPGIEPWVGQWDLAADNIYSQCFFIVRR